MHIWLLTTHSTYCLGDALVRNGSLSKGALQPPLSIVLNVVSKTYLVSIQFLVIAVQLLQGATAVVGTVLWNIYYL